MCVCVHASACESVCMHLCMCASVCASVCVCGGVGVRVSVCLCVLTHVLEDMWEDLGVNWGGEGNVCMQRCV